MSLAEGLLLNHKMSIQMRVMLSNPAFYLVAPIADDEKHFIHGNIGQAIQYMPDDSVAGHPQNRFGTAPGVRPETSPVAGQ